MANIIKVGMADLNVCKSPDGLTTLGLGSCVGICLRDPVSKVGGLAHAMLPDSKQIENNSNRYKFVDTGIDDLINKMVLLGANKSRLEAKIAGGAQMFAFQNRSDMVRVGERNVESAKKILRMLGIPLKAEDTGLNYGRTIIFYPETGELIIRSAGKQEKKI
ncbi:MAG: chemotaxis protein CheD [Lachnospiraceae bacterium]|nr:chemotaxis protein CheD [Lachnospiraceae bacterium]MBQ2407249.1 chemotaxis protein CheD [Lachnospiraceae bacterium]MEE0918822.1 chemotaxis protein CheD [Lachnospiraceae bacterium]